MPDTALVRFDAARRALAEARSIDEIKLVRDQAEALRLYVRQQGESLEMQNDIAEIKLRAERRAGDLLQQIGVQAGNPQLLHDETIAPPRLEDLGISRVQSHRWQAEASVPEEQFEQHVAEIKAAKNDLTSAGLYRLARILNHKALIPSPFPSGKYHVILADPPWQYAQNFGDQAAESHYPTMSQEELCALPVGDIAGPECVLFLWATSPLLPEAFQIISAWGFQYKSSRVWIKERGPSMGWFVHTRHELLLIAVRGQGHPKVKHDSVIMGGQRAHSQKPESVYVDIELAYDGPYLELFARQAHEGWGAWGNEL